MGLFQFGRAEGFPAIYNTNKTSVTVDVIEIIIFSIFTIVAVAFVLIIPGYGKKKSAYIIVKVFSSVIIGIFLMIANFGQEWEVGGVNSTVPYRAGEKRQFTAHIGIKIGLRSVNITLDGKPHGESGCCVNNESIKYNEQFSWTWDQGRFGFGPNAGNLQKSMREAQRRGVPIPIIWVLDYFSIDGEGLRYGRFYRTAGWYCHILLWSALPAWILANIFLQSVGRYAAYFIGLIGTLKVTSCIIWVLIRNPNPLIIRFPDGDIITSYGSTFWLTCVGGILCLLLTLALIVMDLRYPNTLSSILGIDILDQYDECVVRTIELDDITEQNTPVESIELGKITRKFPNKDSGVILLKRRSTIKRAQKNLVHISAVPMKIYNYEEDALYVNDLIHPESSTKKNVKIKFLPPIPKRNVK